MDHRNFDETGTDLGRRLRSLRRAAGLTGPVLGAPTGFSQSKISKLETGRAAPSAADVRALAEALQASPGVELPVLPLDNFALFDRDADQVETLSGELTLRGVRDVQAYADEAKKLDQVMLSTEDTVSFPRVLAR